MKKIMIYVLLISLIMIIITVTLILLLNPLRKSEKGIRKDILKLTPIGSSMEEVIKVIESNEKWENMWINYENKSNHTDLSWDTIIGEKSIKVLMGKYGNIFETHVELYWGFDEDSRLIDIGVRKTIDSL